MCWVVTSQNNGHFVPFNWMEGGFNDDKFVSGKTTGLQWLE